MLKRTDWLRLLGIGGECRVMSDDEKALIRARLLAFLNEPDAAIAQVQFFILSKVSRLDFPRAWYALFTFKVLPLSLCTS